jgi:hypothetical protein
VFDGEVLNLNSKEFQEYWPLEVKNLADESLINSKEKISMHHILVKEM